MTRLASSAKSEPEENLASQLRSARLALPPTGLLATSGFEREYRFDPVRRWRFDFAWPTFQVACEVEGGAFIQGRHTRGASFERDLEKYNAAAIAGWMLLRVTPGMVDDGRALNIIEAGLKAKALTIRSTA